MIHSLKDQRPILRRHLFCLLFSCLALTGCDHGLEPPDVPPTGSIHGVITYEGTWPSAAEFRDLRFVAMRFVPTDTADFLQLNRMAISEGLLYGVAADTFDILGVEAGAFPYSGVAQQFSRDILSWKPIGLYEENGGLFFVLPGETVHLQVLVDFASPPVFPPNPL